MAAFNKTGVFDHAMGHFGIGEINWSTGQTDIFAMLQDNTLPTKATYAHYSDVKAQPSPQLANGNGYTTGGLAIAPITADHNGGGSTIVQFDAADLAIAGSTYSTYGTILNHGVIATDTNALISYHQFGGVQTVVAGTLTIAWAATGCFTITVGAEA